MAKTITATAAYGDGNFPFGFGTKVHLERVETGFVNLGLRGPSNQKWNGATTVLGETIPAGFRPNDAVHFRGYAVENGKTNRNAYVDFVIHPSGKVEAFATGMDKAGAKFELVGGTTYPVKWGDGFK